MNSEEVSKELSSVKVAPRPRKWFLRTSLGAIAAAGPVASYARPVAALESYTLRMSLATSATTSWNISAAQWAEAVGRRSNGRLKIEVYPNSQLAKEQESIDGLQTGLVDLTFQNSTFLEPLFPKVQAFGLPFMLRNAAAALRVVDGPIGNEIFADFKAKGILGLFWGFTGFRELETPGKVIRVPEDMRGMRFRIQGGTVNTAMAQAVGAIPVTIDYSEMRSALAQHTIDVVDSTLVSVGSNKLYTLVKTVAMTNHIFSLQPLIASRSKIEALPADLQKIIFDETKAIIPAWRALTLQQTAEATQLLKDQGMVFNEIAFPAFRKAMDPVYAMLQSKLGGNMVQRISRIANSG
jgi:TRAP-type transport system periplasmic protein